VDIYATNAAKKKKRFIHPYLKFSTATPIDMGATNRTVRGLLRLKKVAEGC
jgi:hypothetical protein